VLVPARPVGDVDPPLVEDVEPRGLFELQEPRGGLAARVFRASLSDRFRVQPQPWPPGLQINGRFD